MTIRPVMENDLPAIAEIYVRGWQAAYRGIVPDSVLDGLSMEARLQRLRRGVKPGEEMIVAEENGTIVGFASFGRCRDSDNNGEAGELWAMYLSPQHRGRGIGSALMRRVLEVLAWREYRQVTLWVLEQNHPARRFYEKIGFTADGAGQELNIGGPVREVRYRMMLPCAA